MVYFIDNSNIDDLSLNRVNQHLTIKITETEDLAKSMCNFVNPLESV